MMWQSPYDTIGDEIVNWIDNTEGAVYGEYVVTISMIPSWGGDRYEITELFFFDYDNCRWVWESDWWEGEKDVRLEGFLPLRDIKIHNIEELKSKNV